MRNQFRERRCAISSARLTAANRSPCRGTWRAGSMATTWPISSWRWWKPWIRARSKRITAGAERPVSAEEAAGAVVLRLCQGDFLPPKDRACHLRTHSCPIPHRGPASGSRQHQHLPATVFAAIRAAFCASLADRPRPGGGEAGGGQSGWDENRRERQPTHQPPRETPRERCASRGHVSRRCRRRCRRRRGRR